MPEPRIIRESWAVESRLREVFDAKKSDFLPIIREVVGAKADYVAENDPINAQGQFMYIHGVRNTRAFFRSKGFFAVRDRNVELVRHPERKLLVGYQTVDLAAVEDHHPQAISGKGSGSRHVMDSAQMSLFSIEGFGGVDQSPPPTRVGLWYICVSANGDDVRAEISLFKTIEDGNFAGYYERIFLLEEGGWSDILERNDEPEDAVEFEPVVRRK